MSSKRQWKTVLVMMIALNFEMLALWLQFDRTFFGRGGAGLDFIRDNFEMGPGDVVIRAQAGFALSVIVALGFLLDLRSPPDN